MGLSDEDLQSVDEDMVKAGVLKPRDMQKTSPLSDILESRFTEYNERMRHLWRISMVRQFHPNELRKLGRNDLVFLAGQTAEGYPNNRYGGYPSGFANKLAQNALRSRNELDRRTAKAGWIVSIVLVVIAAFLAAILTNWIGGAQ